MRSFFVPVTHTRLLRALCLGLLAVAAAASCTTAKDTEATMPSKPGAVQPQPNGKFVTEDSACSQLTKAEAKARSGLSCDAAKHTCPDYIRPAGGEGCFEYDQGSITGCVSVFESFTSCDDFDTSPCLVTAKSSCSDDVGAGGAGGAPGSSDGGMGGMGGATDVPLPDAGAGG